MNANNHRLRTWTEQRMISIPQLFFQFYKELNMEDEEALIVMHLLAFHMEGNDFPTPSDLKNRLTMSDHDITSRLQRLMQKGFLEIIRDVDVSGRLYEKYAVYPLWERIVQMMDMKEQQKSTVTLQQEEGDLFRLFEEEMGRLLSPLELEKIGSWLDEDKHSPALIKEALKEAVFAEKLSIRYIDRILLEWKKKNITTPQAAQKQTEQFRKQQTLNRTPARTAQQEIPPSTNKVPFYNWLEERE
ncbi:DnaD domain-containing protein [Lysinibacillus macroides]|uniref:DNA replication protein n=1 Tax=Lysinibacillus macroides TaxID=33935 RepID=A0A0M9DI04_9BACI|nr:DnaD domain-containing protein [Lysinibacillus macroides]KOY80836.1 DNA replication protein [Lysinibacillus macroides]QPR69978.1 DnaD domain-containing protein [Lysinibacillus macroides]